MAISGGEPEQPPQSSYRFLRWAGEGKNPPHPAWKRKIIQLSPDQGLVLLSLPQKPPCSCTEKAPGLGSDCRYLLSQGFLALLWTRRHMGGGDPLFTLVPACYSHQCLTQCIVNRWNSLPQDGFGGQNHNQAQKKGITQIYGE